MIPESSLPVTSASEAAQQKEPEVQVPEIVKESQEKAGVAGEASAIPESVEKKAEMESELKSEVGVLPPTVEGNTITDQAKEVAGQAVQAAGQVTEKAKEATAGAATTLSATVANLASSTGLAGVPTAAGDQPASPVPELVKDSIAAAGGPTGAAGIRERVVAKKEMESELKEEVVEALPIPESQHINDEPSPASAAEESAAQISEQTAPVVTDGVGSRTTAAEHIALNKPADNAPEPVKDSLQEAGASAEAAGVSAAIGRKEAVEEELKDNVKPTQPISATDDFEHVEHEHAQPMPVEHKSTAPATTAAPTEPVKNGEAAPKRSTDGGNSENSSKKAKRRSWFGALKEKFHIGTRSA
jgi:hypothetical protein